MKGNSIKMLESIRGEEEANERANNRLHACRNSAEMKHGNESYLKSVKTEEGRWVLEPKHSSFSCRSFCL